MALTWTNRSLTEPTGYTDKKEVSVIPVRGKTI